MFSSAVVAMVTGVFKLENDNCASCVHYFSVHPLFHIALVGKHFPSLYNWNSCVVAFSFN